ncbi:TIGR04086 family membrane protein [Pontibacillus sp. HMF3514]|uniref:TIGR04086 family membrane protein n=1 Tax=Pontibacillus sp. HMF3514 TaxID=2692425 RepID=UPI00131F75E3|nr:TIGR04086 family membrane protein [Pontibacillus sp. HMF3514]QHE53111.1 TIGR04086 family membrane protein [Pontibacillus sp. HMF3514]
MFQERMKALGYGWATILVMMLVSSLVLALFLRFTDMTSGTLQWVTLVLGLLTLFIGGFVSGAKGKERGWMLGLFTGLGFVLIVLLFQYLGYQKGMSTTQMMYQGGYTLAAMLGGVIGVNMGGDKQS